eukprot:Amastigsp_a841267_1438.p2 type:complete len:205 gc:universal Amastigsp_a841267_1438:648-34(-)
MGGGRLAVRAEDVCRDVMPHDVLDVLLLEAAFDCQAVVCGKRARRSQLGKDERQDVVRGATHLVADRLEVDPPCTLGAHAHECRRLDIDSLCAIRVGVVAPQRSVHAAEKKVILVVLSIGCSGSRGFSTVAALCCRGLLAFLFLAHSRKIERHNVVAVICGGGRFLCGDGGRLGRLGSRCLLLRLFLRRERELGHVVVLGHWIG